MTHNQKALKISVSKNVLEQLHAALAPQECFCDTSEMDAGHKNLVLYTIMQRPIILTENLIHD